jgi:hypothetical protein
MLQVYANYVLQAAGQQRLCITKNEVILWYQITQFGQNNSFFIIYQAWLPSEDVVLRNMSDSNP